MKRIEVKDVLIRPERLEEIKKAHYEERRYYSTLYKFYSCLSEEKYWVRRDDRLISSSLLEKFYHNYGIEYSIESSGRDNIISHKSNLALEHLDQAEKKLIREMAYVVHFSLWSEDKRIFISDNFSYEVLRSLGYNELIYR